MNKRIVAGVEFEAVRFDHPRPHWRAKCVQTGHIFEAGVFKSATRQKMWTDIEDVARACGERFARETLEAK